MNKKKNNALAVRKNILLLVFLTVIILSAIPAAAFILINLITYYKIDKTFLIHISILTAVLNITAGIIIIIKTGKILNPLTLCTLLDSKDINRIIAKNTAPVKKKFYILYDNKRKIEIKTGLLRRDLEKLYTELQKNKRRHIN